MGNARSRRRLRKTAAATAVELLLTALLAANASAQSDVLVIADDDDRIGSDYRDASFGIADGGDFLLLRGANANKLPVEPDHAFVGENAMTLQWRHQAGGRWDMFVAAPGWVGMNVSDFDSLVFFVNGPDSIDGAELPMVGLEDTQNVKSALADMGARLPALDDDTLSWQRVALPLTDFEPYGGFDPTSLKTVRFSNSSVNDTVRTMWVDLIAMIRGPAATPAQVSGLNARVGDRSVILHEIPDKVEFRLEPSHPNPFSTTTQVSFTLPTGGHVRLDVYDVIGRHVATLLDHVRPAGSHDVEIDGSGWTNGVYLISLRFDDQVATRPVTRIK